MSFPDIKYSFPVAYRGWKKEQRTKMQRTEKKTPKTMKEKYPNQQNSQNFLKQIIEVFNYTHTFHSKKAPISVFTL